MLVHTLVIISASAYCDSQNIVQKYPQVQTNHTWLSTNKYVTNETGVINKIGKYYRKMYV